MARLDVYRPEGGAGYLLDCQSDMMFHLETKLMVPLFLHEDAPMPVGRLNPVFVVDGVRVVMMTQYASAMRTSQIGMHVARLDREHDAVRDAFDTLLVGY